MLDSHSKKLEVKALAKIPLVGCNQVIHINGDKIIRVTIGTQ